MSDLQLVDRLRSWVSAATLRRYRTSIEGAVAFLYLLIASLSVSAHGGVLGVLSALLLASTLVLYRIQPLLSLALGAMGTLGMLGAANLWMTGHFGLFLPLLAVFFGAAAYGHPATRWLALPGTLVAALALFGASGNRSTGALTFLFLLTLFALAWVGGLLLATSKARQLAQTGQVVATVQLGEARQAASLEQERNRVARDVHDIVAHSLAVVIAQADGARYAAKDTPPAVAEALENIAATARGALTDVRVLLGELRHNQEAGPQPGMNDLDALVRGFRESGLDIRWSSYGVAAPLGDAAGLAVYRIVQEALTNALRHGERSAPVDLEFDWGQNALGVVVTNDLPDGAGASNPEGHGLPGMRERASLAGGDFLAGDGTNGRFRVRATLPVDRAAAETVAS